MKRSLERIRKEGFTRARIDGEMVLINEEEVKLEKQQKHIIEIVVDRIICQGRSGEPPGGSMRTGDLPWRRSGSGAYKTGGSGIRQDFQHQPGLPEHGVSVAELEPRMFSFNNPFGACPDCNGLGFNERIDPDLIITDQEKSIPEGCLSAIFASMEFSGFYRQLIDALAEYHGVDIHTPYKDLPKKFKRNCFTEPENGI